MSTLTVSPRSPLQLSLKHLLAKHPFVSYFVLAFAGAWLWLAPLVLGQQGLGLLPYQVPLWLYIVLFMGATFAGPTLAAFVITAAQAGSPGVRRYLGRYVQWRVGWRWYLLFLVGFPLLYLIPATFWLGMAPWQALVQQWPTLFTVYLPGILIFPAIINWGEEAGWRGFAQTQMQAHYGPLPTAILVGLLHGIWHLPAFLLVEGPPALGPFDLTTFLFNSVLIAVFTIIWTWIFNGAQQSILIASLMHASFNASQAWVNSLLPHLPEQVGTATAVIIVTLALLIVVLTKGRLGYTPSQVAMPNQVKVSDQAKENHL